MNKDKALGIAIMIVVLCSSIGLAVLISSLILSYPHEAMHVSLIVVFSAILFSIISRMIMRNE